MRIDKARAYVVDNLQYALNPSSIAVVGASRYPSKVGNKVVAELLEWGYTGKIYPVDVYKRQVQGTDNHQYQRNNL